MSTQTAVQPQTDARTCFICHAAKATTTQTIDYANSRARIVIEVPACIFCADPVDTSDDEPDDIGAERFAEWMAEVDEDDRIRHTNEMAF